MQIKRGKTVTISSVKGGTGKTTFLINLAGVLESMGKKTLIMDLDLYSGAVELFLNLNCPKDMYNLADDLNNNRYKDFKDYVRPYSKLIDVLPSPKDPRQAGKIDSKYIDLALLRAQTLYDVILIDTNHILNESNLVIYDQSDLILFLLTNDVATLKNTKSLLTILDDANLSNYRIIINEAANVSKKFFNELDIKNIIEKNPDYVIPRTFYIENINKVIMNNKILDISHMNKNVYSKFVKIAEDILKQVIEND